MNIVIAYVIAAKVLGFKKNQTFELNVRKYLSNIKVFSMLKRLKTAIRNSMGEARMSHLAMIEANYDFLDDNEKILNNFIHNCSRRLDFYVE